MHSLPDIGFHINPFRTSFSYSFDTILLIWTMDCTAVQGKRCVSHFHNVLCHLKMFPFIWICIQIEQGQWSCVLCTYMFDVLLLVREGYGFHGMRSKMKLWAHSLRWSDATNEHKKEKKTIIKLIVPVLEIRRANDGNPCQLLFQAERKLNEG